MLDRKDNTVDYNNYIKTLESGSLINKDETLTYWSNYPINAGALSSLYKAFTTGSTFLDLGAGCGNVLRYAKNIGYDVYGVEFDSKYTASLQEYNFQQADITTLPDSFYSTFDVIYCYYPLKAGFAEYIDKVVTNMKPGASIITPMFNIRLSNQKGLRMQGPYDNMYKKIVAPTTTTTSTTTTSTTVV